MQKQDGQSVSLLTGIVVSAFTCLTAIPLEFKNLIQKEMEAETVDYIEWKTGRRVEGIMLIPMHFYNITGDSHRKMMKEIAQRNNDQIEKDSTVAVNE